MSRTNMKQHLNKVELSFILLFALNILFKKKSIYTYFTEKWNKLEFGITSPRKLSCSSSATLLAFSWPCGMLRTHWSASMRLSVSSSGSGCGADQQTVSKAVRIRIWTKSVCKKANILKLIGSNWLSPTLTIV